MSENYSKILKAIDLCVEEIKDNKEIKDIPKLFSREELINLQLAIVKGIAMIF
ncbi:MAG: hypothetical protein ACTSU2_13170 [Promethearchaeota archaeon]